MKCLITVGSTKFDALINRVSQHCEMLQNLGYEVIVQHGASPFPTVKGVRSFDYHPDLPNIISTCQLIITHAGSGTLIEAMRAHVPAIVAVINETLADNHQAELAQKLTKEGFIMSCNVEGLFDVLQHLVPLKEFPAQNKTLFRDHIDHLMGFYTC